MSKLAMRCGKCGGKTLIKFPDGKGNCCHNKTKEGAKLARNGRRFWAVREQNLQGKFDGVI